MTITSHTPDMLRAARFRQDSGRPHVLPDRSKFGRTSMMTHPSPATIAMPVDELRALVEDANQLAARFGILYAAVVEDADEEPTAAAFPSNVFSLADFQSRRQAVSR